VRDLTARLRSLVERQAPFGEENVDQLRAEFIQLMKNVERVKTYLDGDKLRTAIMTWREHFDSTVFKLLIPFLLGHISAKRGIEQSSLWRAENKAIKDDIDGWVKHWEKKIREACYPLISDLSLPLDRPESARWTHQLSMSGSYWTAQGIDHKEAILAGIMEKFEKDSPKWLARVKRLATPAWKALREYFVWLETQNVHGAATKVTVPVRESANLDIEKFKVRLVDYEDDRELHVTALAKLRLALKLYRARAAKVFPWLLQHPIPFHLETDCGFDWAGRYEYEGHVKLCALGMNSPPEKGAHIIAHEMGHHVWNVYLSHEAADFWKTAIASDRGTLDLVALQKVWREQAPEGHLSDLEKVLAGDSTLFLQVQTLTYGHGNFGKSVFFSLEELDALIASGTTQYPVPNNPITAYAAKNPEEAFCEAFGMLVAYGPRVVAPIVKQWLAAILPALHVESVSLQSLVVETRELLIAKGKGDGSFLAIVLDGPSRTKLIDWWEDATRIPLLQKTLAHHVTLVFQPSPEQVAATPLGQRVSFTANGWAADSKAQVARVDIPLQSVNTIPHVTLSVAAGVLPAYSKDLLAREVTSAPRLRLTGTIEYILPEK
jgi:hypothetical protein